MSILLCCQFSALTEMVDKSESNVKIWLKNKQENRHRGVTCKQCFLRFCQGCTERIYLLKRSILHSLSSITTLPLQVMRDLGLYQLTCGRQDTSWIGCQFIIFTPMGSLDKPPILHCMSLECRREPEHPCRSADSIQNQSQDLTLLTTATQRQPTFLI